MLSGNGAMLITHSGVWVQLFLNVELVSFLFIASQLECATNTLRTSSRLPRQVPNPGSAEAPERQVWPEIIGVPTVAARTCPALRSQPMLPSRNNRVSGVPSRPGSVLVIILPPWRARHREARPRA